MLEEHRCGGDGLQAVLGGVMGVVAVCVVVGGRRVPAGRHEVRGSALLRAIRGGRRGQRVGRQLIVPSLDGRLEEGRDHAGTMSGPGGGGLGWRACQQGRLRLEAGVGQFAGVLAPGTHQEWVTSPVRLPLERVGGGGGQHHRDTGRGRETTVRRR